MWGTGGILEVGKDSFMLFVNIQKRYIFKNAHRFTYSQKSFYNLGFVTMSVNMRLKA
jgi:hypothetical protein